MASLVHIARHTCTVQTKESSPTCAMDKFVACNALRAVREEANAIDMKIAEFNADAGYVQLRTHETLEPIGDVTGLLEPKDAEFLNCDHMHFIYQFYFGKYI